MQESFLSIEAAARELNIPINIMRELATGHRYHRDELDREFEQEPLYAVQ